MQILRPYQDETVEAVFQKIEEGFTQILYVLPTGTGKTTTFAEICRVFLSMHQDSRILCLAHRREIIVQMYKTIRAQLGLHASEIGIELADQHAPIRSKVVCGSVQTLCGEKRFLGDFHLIITDEAHHAVASNKSYQRIYDRYGVGEGTLHVGCTATAKRHDRKSIFALGLDGAPVKLKDKQGKEFFADTADSAFEVLAYEMKVDTAIEDGWLVPIRQYRVKTDCDLSKIKTVGGDFDRGELAKVVNNEKRTNAVISGWKQYGLTDRPTLAFCASVEHASDTCDMVRAAGYTAEFICGETDDETRISTLERFKKGELQWLCNYGIYTEGTDIPNCACVAMLRPTEVWSLFVQMVGRGLRPQSGILEGLLTPSERLAAIVVSSKPDCVVLDVTDKNLGRHNICTVPSILDLPADIDLEGNSLTKTKELLAAYVDASEHLMDEGKLPPKTFTELKVRLEEVDLIRNSKSKSRPLWKATATGFAFTGVPPGFTAVLDKTSDVDFALRVRHKGGLLLEKKGLKRENMNDYLLEYAATQAKEAVERKQKQTPYVAKLPHGTVPVTGNTYPHKDAIKAMGGRWINGAWHVPQHRANEAQALVRGEKVEA